MPLKEAQTVRGFAVALALIGWLLAPRPSAGQDALARAMELYSSAAYEEALAAFDGLQAEATGPAAIEVSRYRAFCLLALQRTGEAKQTIEAMVRADPLYRLSEAQFSPRIQAVFQEVRRATLPGVVQAAYAAARQAQAEKDLSAAKQFERVLTLIDDPDMREAMARYIQGLLRDDGKG